MGQYFQVNGDYNIKAKDTGTITLQAGDVKVVGNLTVIGSSSNVNSINLDIKDRIITLNKGESSSGVTATYAGIEIDRGSSSRAALVFDETNPTGIGGSVGTWIIGSGTDPSYGFADSNLKLRRILTDASTDSGDLTLIGTGTGVVKVAGTTNYRLQVTDSDDIPNKDYVDYSILNNPTFQIRAPQSQDTRVIIADIDITPNLITQSGSLAYYNNIPGVLPTTESLVSVIIDGVVSSEFFEDRIVLQGLVASSQEITSVNNSGNIYIRTQGTGNLQTNRGFQLDNTGATPAIVSGSHVIYSKAESIGRTGIFFVNTENTRDELVSKNRALLFSMLF
jgi:hypothetical protein